MAKRPTKQPDKFAYASPEIRETVAALDRVAKRVLRSKASARKFLIDAGILDKSGKRLAAPYR